MNFPDYDINDIDYNYNNPPHMSSNDDHQQSSSSSHNGNDLLTTYRCVLLNYPANKSSTLVYYTLWLTTANPLYPPTDFTPLHHLIYQVSQLLIFLYVALVKSSLPSLCLLLCYSVLQVLWGLVVLKSIDIFTWNSLIGVVCGVKAVRSVCRSWWGSRGNGGGGTSTAINKRRKKHALLFSPGKNTEIEQIYTRLFAPVRVSYKQFLRVVGCKRGFKLLGCGENYAIEKRSRVDSLGLLVSGRLVVSQGGKALHVILPFQFVDSPEYFGVATGDDYFLTHCMITLRDRVPRWQYAAGRYDELFQVTITALEESKLLVWHRDKLRLTIMNDEFLRVMFDHIIGRDVVRKLIQVSDSIMTTPTSTTYNQSTSPTNGTPSSTLLPSTNLLFTSLSQHHGTTTTTTTTTTSSPGQQQQQQPVIMVRKDKYAYQPTYLTALSEENNGNNKGSGAEDEEEEEDDEDEEEDCEEGIQEDGIISGNEKEPMLDDTVALK